ncbi:7113_t:CDS:2 [Entrophospora sp. SA101]|nr:7113_t:CDS:2 [Entrophospora sp. SA101]
MTSALKTICAAAGLRPILMKPDLFCDENPNNSTISFAFIKEVDVGFILELVRYTCEMLAKGIPQRKKTTERGIDVLIKKTHIFICDENPNNSTISFAFIKEVDVGFILELVRYTKEMVFRSSRDRWSEATDAPDNVEDIYGVKHDIGKALSYDQEFSLCERPGSKIENDTNFFSDILKVLKTLRDMRKSLVKVITMEDEAKFDIPTSYGEIGTVVKIAHVTLQIKERAEE